ncbi:predicted protein [Nematostella vectensis]|uniref:Protein kinase domain-containing protein n=1 Tax=Nematostella vectensis TaxID=45351 RepID=A7SGT7_NEMVE|nr:predicted protein [Nematostella vectensis]|eukprot:XP_001629128.1 predicted protein [Nematostella vectensis]
MPRGRREVESRPRPMKPAVSDFTKLETASKVNHDAATAQMTNATLLGPQVGAGVLGIGIGIASNNTLIASNNTDEGNSTTLKNSIINGDTHLSAKPVPYGRPYNVITENHLNEHKTPSSPQEQSSLSDANWQDGCTRAVPRPGGLSSLLFAWGRQGDGGLSSMNLAPSPSFSPAWSQLMSTLDSKSDNLTGGSIEDSKHTRELLIRERALRIFAEQQLEEQRQRCNELEQQLEQERQQKAELEMRTEQLSTQLQENEDRVAELAESLTVAQRSLDESRQASTHDWVLEREEIILTDNIIGVGAWGQVIEGSFRKCTVAVKQIHELILSPHNRRLFEREMAIASRCRHPCLLQFIGATNDDLSPLFVTELLDASLRAVLQERALGPMEVKTLALDIAQALNYLHENKPTPIIHRDISSANVLLWRHMDVWRGKVSDYGTANFVHHSMTVSPGAVVYSPPEAHTSRQSPKAAR